jgi:hypothetical protein
MHTVKRGCLAAVLASVAGGALGQSPVPLMRQSFDEGTGGWIAIGTNARASITRQNSYNGQGALKLDYDVQRGSLCAVVLASPGAALAKARAFRFWVDADYGTTLAVILQEKDGARYVSPFYAPKGAWQKVELAVSDFAILEGPGNPPDADGKLSMDKVAAVALADAGQIFGMAGSPDLEKVLGVTTGPHSLLVDDFTATDESLPPAATSSPTEVRIDTFVRPQLGWLSVGSAVLARAAGSTPAEHGLRADYRQAPGRIMGVMRVLPRGKLAGMSRISFSVASVQGLTLLVQVGESGGAKFNASVDVRAGGEAQTVALDLEGFQPADDSPVKDRKVKPELVGLFVVLDPTGIAGLPGEQDNTLRIWNVRASAAEPR